MIILYFAILQARLGNFVPAWKSSQRLLRRAQITGETSLGQPGGRLNKKDGLTRYGDSHVKDKTS